MWVDEAAKEFYADVLKEAAQLRIAYHLESRDSLDKLAATEHHEGIVAAAIPRHIVPIEKLDKLPQRSLYLGLVGNPHNAGALLRTAGFLGFNAAVFAQQKPTTSLSRVAEGGLDALDLLHGEALETVHRYRELGASIVAADHRSEQSLAQWKVRTPMLLVMGHEQHGIPPAILELASERINIRGGGAVESLNVSVAGGILMSHATQNTR